MNETILILVVFVTLIVVGFFNHYSEKKAQERRDQFDRDELNLRKLEHENNVRRRKTNEEELVWYKSTVELHFMNQSKKQFQIETSSFKAPYKFNVKNGNFSYRDPEDQMVKLASNVMYYVLIDEVKQIGLKDFDVYNEM